MKMVNFGDSTHSEPATVKRALWPTEEWHLQSPQHHALQVPLPNSIPRRMNTFARAVGRMTRMIAAKDKYIHWKASPKLKL